MNVRNMKQQRGFTLMEMMIVDAVIAILVGVAIASYSGQMRKGRRAAAQAELGELAQFMERRYTKNDTYCGVADCSAPPTLPFTGSPKDDPRKYYTLTVVTPAPAA